MDEYTMLLEKITLDALELARSGKNPCKLWREAIKIARAYAKRYPLKAWAVEGIIGNATDAIAGWPNNNYSESSYKFTAGWRAYLGGKSLQATPVNKPRPATVARLLNSGKLKFRRPTRQERENYSTPDTNFTIAYIGRHTVISKGYAIPLDDGEPPYLYLAITRGGVRFSYGFYRSGKPGSYVYTPARS